jgi:hypothetical protein
MYAIEIIIDGTPYGITIKERSYNDAIKKIEGATISVLGESIETGEINEMTDGIFPWRYDIGEA